MYLNLGFLGVDINKPLHPKHHQKQLHAWFTLNNYCTNYSSSSLTSIGCESIVIMRPFCNLLENTNSCTALHLQHWLFTTNVYWAGQRSEESSIPTLIQITSQAFSLTQAWKEKKTWLLTLVLLLPIIFPFQRSSLLYLVSSSSSLAFPFHKTRQEWSFRSQPVCRDLVSIMMLQKLYLYTIYVCSIPVVMSVGVF